ncbi:DEAD/DEAH box helicase [Afifella marina]|uniref:DEAD-box ATP-dependent RNA helicase RhpA n=1 Tax=Afifella marina DSM 2698 TaxID=1120955 RepID=A0A1G5NK97_AFIMA|nr:DEAD/DEAH box helicase [Afifella marina]MBK1623713.1 ATP-dependent helicase [Afifella marina DSM 2698]MBK1626706.1 ATP-dependent helicase [Afifella marina]MBK5916255.1 DEAD/DEAH box helicase [Afifella marina]RAI21555.1 DEAD/DEAH box helicase [Afifella marina DSM 2698]SCZ37816.1 Superfamily II DNA and RNA helicase [Afifella marina DSM 2698]
MSFDNLGLSDKVLQAVHAVGYTEPTPIQAAAIPHVLAGRDVLGLAQTGTGKTASFTLPMLTLLERGRARARMPRTLILEPTRELAAQVEDNFSGYGANHKLTVALLIGGISFDEQDKKLTRGADVLIATPGRLLDHFERGRLLLTGVEVLVIDEADRMLDMGFIPDIERIVSLITATRKPQTLLFSATMPKEIATLAAKFMTNPERVEVSRPSSTAENVSQHTVVTGRKPHEKRVALRALIDREKDLTNAIIFCNRKRDVATLERSLRRHGYSAGALHGDMDQHARLATLESFRENRISLLVASDVAARGLDIPAVSHIFNFDVPTHAEDYVHRIGRTGRAGRTGRSFTLMTAEEKKYVTAIEKLIHREIPPLPDFEAAEPEADEEDERPRRSSSRRGKSGSRERSRSGKPASKTDAAEVAASESPAPAEARSGQTKSDHGKAEHGKSEHGKASARSESRPQRNDKPQQSGRSKGKQQRQRDEEPVGFGDHVPAFLLQPVRVGNS